MAVKKVTLRGKPKWRARVLVDGKQKTAWRDRKDDAVKAEAELLALAPASKERSGVEEQTFAEHWAEYLRDAAATTNKPSTLEAKRSIYEHHLGPFFGSMEVAEIKVRDIDRYKAEKLKTHSPKSVNNQLTVLRNALTVAARWSDHEMQVPHISWALVEKPGFRFLDFDEAARLVEAAKQEPLAHAMIVVATNTGLRLGELLALRWDALDLKAGSVHVRKAVAVNVEGTPKNKRSRIVPLNDTALEALKSYRHLRGPYVFCREDGKRLTKNEAKGPLRRARARSGVAHCGWHALRHTFASHLTMRGVPLKAVQELLGHATIEMTMRYAHLSPDVVRDAVRALDAAPGVNTGVNRAGLERKTAP